MKKIIFTPLLICALCFTLTVEAKTVTVAAVIDGDTFTTEQGERVRLLHINTPEMGHDGRRSQPFAEKAKKRLKNLIEGRRVTLKFETTERDRYKRLLAHVYKGKKWINKEMISSGLAHVYTFPDNRGAKINSLIQAEQIARDHAYGFWKTARWTVRNTDRLDDDTLIGKYQLIQGKVKNVAEVKGITYLNFGNDWRNDFTVEIPKKFKKYFTESGIKPKTFYQGKELLVRGVLKPVNGTLITATHPEQLTIISK